MLMTTLEQLMRSSAKRLAASPTPMLDARLIIQHTLQYDAADVIRNARSVVEPRHSEVVHALVERRRLGEPVAQILGEKEFFGRMFRLATGVLTPRPETEHLIDVVFGARAHDAPLRILDLGVGSGCILVTLLAHFQRAIGYGVDINPVAARLARANADRHQVGDRATFWVGDWFDALDGEFDLIVANPPYIPDNERAALSDDVRYYEDPRALFAGQDGLDAYRAILGAVHRHMKTGALISMEVGAGQANAVNLLAKEAFGPSVAVSITPDLAGIDRIVTVDSQCSRH